jgi:hypothetical protein
MGKEVEDMQSTATTLARVPAGEHGLATKIKVFQSIMTAL